MQVASLVKEWEILFYLQNYSPYVLLYLYIGISNLFLIDFERKFTLKEIKNKTDFFYKKNTHIQNKKKMSDLPSFLDLLKQKSVKLKVSKYNKKIEEYIYMDDNTLYSLLHNNP